MNLNITLESALRLLNESVNDNQCSLGPYRPIRKKCLAYIEGAKIYLHLCVRSYMLVIKHKC